MTVQNQTYEVIANGNDVATSFSFSPMVLPDDSSQLQVTIIDEDGVEGDPLTEGTGGTNYAVVVSSYPGTGSVTYPASGATRLATGERIRMKRVLTLEQQTDLENQGGYFLEVQEAALDRLVMIDLQQQEELDRTLQFAPAFDLTSFDREIPAGGEANEILALNADADAFEWLPGYADAIAATAADVVLTHADVVLTHADVVLTHADVVLTHADAASTAADVIAAAASAASAAAAAGSNLFNTVSDKSADFSAAADTDDGTMFKVDSSGGSVNMTLPSIATAGEGRRYGVYRVSASNTVQLVPNGTDTINGIAANYVLSAVAGELTVIVADDASPDNWVAFVWTQAQADGATLTKSGSVISLNVGNGNNWTAPQRSGPLTDNDGSFDLSAKTNFACTPSGATAISFSNEATQAGQTGIIELINTGGHVITFGAECLGRSGLAADLSVAGTYILGYYVNAAADKVHIFDSPAQVAL